MVGTYKTIIRKTKMTALQGWLRTTVLQCRAVVLNCLLLHKKIHHPLSRRISNQRSIPGQQFDSSHSHLTAFGQHPRFAELTRLVDTYVGQKQLRTTVLHCRAVVLNCLLFHKKIRHPLSRRIPDQRSIPGQQFDNCHSGLTSCGQHPRFANLTRLVETLRRPKTVEDNCSTM
jgi:hypothetical protein